jgi:MFS family permease
VLHAGAVGYGWLNGGWAIGALLSTVYTAWLIRKLGSRHTVAVNMALLSFCWFALPYSPVLTVAVVLYGIGGSARGITGVALSTAVMETVPKHFMGRVQNTIYLAGTMLQLMLGMIVGYIAHHRGLAPAFAIIATLYLGGFMAALVPVKEPVKESGERRAEATVA